MHCLAATYMTVRPEPRPAKALHEFARSRPRLPNGKIDLSAVVRELLDRALADPAPALRIGKNVVGHVGRSQVPHGRTGRLLPRERLMSALGARRATPTRHDEGGGGGG